MSHNHKLIVYAVAVVLLGVVAYGLSLDGPLFFDDEPNITQNPLLQFDGSVFDDWRVATVSGSSGPLRRPVAMFSFALNQVLSGEFDAASLKAFNLLIHLVIAVLVYFFAAGLLRAPATGDRERGDLQWVALLAAAIWFLHPLHVSTVLYAVQRMAQLSTLLVVAGLLVFTRYRLRWAAQGASTGEFLAAILWILLLGCLAVLSKENGALLPWLIIVVEVCLFQGLWRGAKKPLLVWSGWMCMALPLLLLALLFLVSPELITGGFVGREFSLSERLLTQNRLLWRYIGWLVFPNIMDMGFQHDDILLSRSVWQPLTTGWSLLAWCALLAASLVWRRRYPFLLFAVLFFLVGHFMESTVLALEMVYEHRNYLPSIGIVVLLAVALHWLGRLTAPGIRPAVLGGGVLLMLVVLLFVRSHTWSDKILLAKFNVVNHPTSSRSHFFYAMSMFDRYQQRQALKLDEEEARALAVTSRVHFEKMHEIDGRDVAPIVMLYQIDSMLFPGMRDTVDWLGVLEQLIQTRVLQASDYTSLMALIEYFSQSPENADKARFAALLDKLVERYPGRANVLMLKFKMMAATEGYSPPQLLAALELVAAADPYYLEVYPYIMMHHDKAADHTAVREAARDWMQRDPHRRELSILRRAFANQ